MKKRTALIYSTIANADLLENSIESDKSMTWTEAKRFCSSVDAISSFALPPEAFFASLNDTDKAILKNDKRYWADKVGIETERKAYGVYPSFAIDLVWMHTNKKLRVICVKKSII
jgi:hypothetical protein